MQFLSQSQLQQKLDEISDEFDAWVDETDGKFDIDTFFFGDFSKSLKTKKKIALHFEEIRLIIREISVKLFLNIIS